MPNRITGMNRIIGVKDVNRVTGVVLAGGKSTRLPHKLFLSLRNGRPLYASAVDLLLDAGVSPVMLVAEEFFHTFRSINGKLYGRRAPELIIDSGEGIGPALRCMRRHSALPLLVLCGDNVYGAGTLDVDLGNVPWAAVNARAERHGLDGFVDGVGWVHRPARADGFVPLTTPWYFPQAELEGNTAVELLTAAGAHPLRIDDPEWRDLGTPESFAAYYRGP